MSQSFHNWERYPDSQGGKHFEAAQFYQTFSKMQQASNLKRFLQAQERDYVRALREISSGKKRSHWMWYIFPQVQGLGLSETSRYYAIKNLEEAKAYLADPVLGKRLIEISKVLLTLDTGDAHKIFGDPDDMKLRSSMTLFSAVPGADPVFESVLAKFFGGRRDETTMSILRNPAEYK